MLFTKINVVKPYPTHWPRLEFGQFVFEVTGVVAEEVNIESALYYATQANPRFRRVPDPSDNEALSGSRGFDVDSNGHILFTKGQTIYKYVPDQEDQIPDRPDVFYQDQSAGTGPELYIMSCGPENEVAVLGYSETEVSFRNIYFFSKTNSMGSLQPLFDSNISGRSRPEFIELDFLYDGLSFTNEGKLFYTQLNAAELVLNNTLYIYWRYYDKPNSILGPINGPLQLTGRIPFGGLPEYPCSNYDGNYVYAWNPWNNGIPFDSANVTRLLDNGADVVLGITLSTSPRISMASDGTFVYMMDEEHNQITRFKPDLGVSPTVLVLVNYAEPRDAATNMWYDADRLWYGTMAKSRTGLDELVPVIRFVDLGTQSFRTADEWVTAEYPLFLCDNGDIVRRETDEIGIIVAETGTGDTADREHFSDCDIEIGPEPKISTNGRYIASTNPVRLVQNLPNNPQLSEYCSTDPQRLDLCLVAYSAYLAATPDDPRNYCFENSAQILDDLYTPERVAQIRDRSPLTYQKLLRIAPRLTQRCSAYFNEDTLMRRYLDTLNIPTNSLVCSEFVTFKSSEVNANELRVTQNCQSVISCTEATCAIGTSCDLRTNVCQYTCLASNECPTFSQCTEGFCVPIPPSDDTPLFSNNSIVMLTMALALAVVFLSLGIVFRKKK